MILLYIVFELSFCRQLVYFETLRVFRENLMKPSKRFAPELDDFMVSPSAVSRQHCTLVKKHSSAIAATHREPSAKFPTLS